MPELGVIRVLRDYVKEISVDVVGIISEEPGNKLDTAELYVKDFRVDDEIAINLGALVDVFLLAYNDILIGGREFFRVDCDSAGSVPGRPGLKGARQLFNEARLYLDLLL